MTWQRRNYLLNSTSDGDITTYISKKKMNGKEPSKPVKSSLNPL
jgi:hypothetical protein